MRIAGALRTGLALAVLMAGAAQAQERKPPSDLADAAQGVYAGAVISDARGSSQEGVRVTVAKTAPDTVQVTSDYARLPARTFKLTRAMQTIQNAGGGPEVFLLDLAKSPPRLDLTIDDASWSGDRIAAGR